MSIKKQTATAPAPEVDTPATCYTSLHKLPFEAFEDCIVDNNLSALIISGEPTQVELEIAWEMILEQYEEEIELSLADKLLLHLQIEVYRELQKIERAKKIADILRVCYVKSLVEDLQKLAGVGYGQFKYYQFDYKDLASYHKDLESCLRRITVNLLLRRKEAELKHRLAQQAQKETFTPTRSYYTKIFLNLSSYKGYHISKRDVTAGEFCQLVNELNKYAEEMKSQAKK